MVSPRPTRVAGCRPWAMRPREARIDYAAERLRLLYVGITRAKRDLIVTWNTGRSPSGALQPAAPLIALHAWWEGAWRGACSGERGAGSVVPPFVFRLALVDTRRFADSLIR